MMGKLENQIKQLLIIGDVGFYTTVDGGYGCSLEFYDESYYLAHPSDTVKGAVSEMLDEWRVQAALAKPDAYHQIAHKKKYEKAEDEFYATDLQTNTKPKSKLVQQTKTRKDT